MPTLELKVGDALFVPSPFGSTNQILAVDRITKTLAVLSDGTKISLNNGKVLGTSGYCTRYARLANDKDILAARIAAAQDSLRRIVVTAENVERVIAAIEKINAPK